MVVNNAVGRLGRPGIVTKPQVPGRESKQPPTQSCSRPMTRVPPEGITLPLERCTLQTCTVREKFLPTTLSHLDSFGAIVNLGYLTNPRPCLTLPCTSAGRTPYLHNQEELSTQVASTKPRPCSTPLCTSAGQDSSPTQPGSTFHTVAINHARLCSEPLCPVQHHYAQVQAQLHTDTPRYHFPHGGN